MRSDSALRSARFILPGVLLLLNFSFLPAQEPAAPAKPVTGPAKWETEAAKYEAAEKKSPSPKGAVLFSGSSSIRLWDLKKSFPDLPVINRGLGGSIIPDNTHYVERLIWPHEPKLIVFYAGDNDIQAKRTSQQVLDDFQNYVAKVRTKLPKTPILYLPIKPSVARWGLYAAQKEANAKVKTWCESADNVTYVDTAPATLGEDGKPRKDYLKEDGLHLNEAGYEAWTRILRPVIDAKLKAAAPTKS